MSGSVFETGMLSIARRDADGEVQYGFDALSMPLLRGLLRTRGVLAWERKRDAGKTARVTRFRHGSGRTPRGLPPVFLN